MDVFLFPCRKMSMWGQSVCQHSGFQAGHQAEKPCCVAIAVAVYTVWLQQQCSSSVPTTTCLLCIQVKWLAWGHCPFQKSLWTTNFSGCLSKLMQNNAKKPNLQICHCPTTSTSVVSHLLMIRFVHCQKTHFASCLKEITASSNGITCCCTSFGQCKRTVA